MKRQSPAERVEPFRQRQAELVTEGIRDGFVEWAAGDLDALATHEPEMPPELVDRAADVWESLIALGDFAGPMWSRRIRDAAVELNTVALDGRTSLGLRLLAVVTYSCSSPVV